MRNLEAIVNDYIREWRAPARAERWSFVRESSLESAISRAALCKLSNGKRHPHQYRVPEGSLRQAKKRLLRQKARILGCTTFDELHDLVNGLIRDIWMIGELVVYDIATRIGAFMRLEPKQIYLHRGTRDGARALGIRGPLPKLAVSDIPKDFARLSPGEIEDCLCIYKDKLRGKASIRSGICSRITSI